MQRNSRAESSASPHRLPALGSRLALKKNDQPYEPLTNHAFNESELLLLDEIACRHGLTVDAVLRLLEVEAAFLGMGRRRGLFPKLRELVVEITDGGRTATKTSS
jgi:hypothetical protein